ncbi:hypothetical protein GCM10025734_14090 [Kitasatospora paranensis]
MGIGPRSGAAVQPGPGISAPRKAFNQAAHPSRCLPGPAVPLPARPPPAGGSGAAPTSKAPASTVKAPTATVKTPAVAPSDTPEARRSLLPVARRDG